jgi:AAA+ ATPase superfamily predicted ATPase
MTGSISQTSDMIEMLNGATGAFGGRMIQINIDPFTKQETESYFEERFPEIEFTQEGFDRFYEYTKGIPMYINSFYNALSSHETYDENSIDYIFLNNMDQILVMWIRIWGTLNNYEKNIICTMLNQVHITWSELEKNLDMAPATLNKYIKTLQDKGIINYYDGKYSLEDLMLETWLNHEKERTGVYPY